MFAIVQLIREIIEVFFIPQAPYRVQNQYEHIMGNIEYMCWDILFYRNPQSHSYAFNFKIDL